MPILFAIQQSSGAIYEHGNCGAYLHDGKTEVDLDTPTLPHLSLNGNLLISYAC
jgi:hypothetical protein